mgnify:CR=1 FL=1
MSGRIADPSGYQATQADSRVTRLGYRQLVRQYTLHSPRRR